MAASAFDVIAVSLAADKTTSDTIVASYPTGRTAGSYKLGNVHQLTVNGQTLVYPKDFSISFGSSSATLTILAAATFKTGSVAYVQLNRGGAGSWNNAVAAVAGVAASVSHNVEIVPLVLVSLGSPAAASATAVAASQTPSGAGNLTLAGSATKITADVPRVVTISSGANDVSAVNFTVTGKDEHGVAMTETIAGPNATTAVGKKAFKVVTQVAVDGAPGHAITAGFGSVLGLPVVLTATGLVVKEIYDGAVVTNGTFVAADNSAPSATTGDVRGTYSPNTAPNGTHAYQLLIALVDMNVAGAQA